MSEHIPAVYGAIAAVQAALAKQGIAKARKNQQQGYDFRGIDDVYAAIAPLLAEHGLCIIPRVLSRTCTERQTQRGGALFYTCCDVEYTVAAVKDGSTVTARIMGEAMDSGDKSTNKAMSAAYKYLALQLFCIPTEGDNDADASSHEVRAAPRAQRPYDVQHGLSRIKGAEDSTVLDIVAREEWKAAAGNSEAQTQIKAARDARLQELEAQ